MLKKLIGLGIVATFLAFTTSAYAAIGDDCDDGSGAPDDAACEDGELCDPDLLTCVDDGSGGTDGCVDDSECGDGEICDDASGECVPDDTGGGLDCDDGTGNPDDSVCADTEVCDDVTLTCVDDGGGDGGGCSVTTRGSKDVAGAGLLALALLGLVGMARRRRS